MKGVLLVNVGTPDAPTPEAVKGYLRVFLSDRRVIKKQGLLWKVVLNGIILRKRPPKVAKRYEAIWTKGGSPLLVYLETLQSHLQSLLPSAKVEIGMSYSKPTISQALDRLLKEGVTNLTIVPLFPQYSGTTVGPIFDTVSEYFRKTDKIINLQFIASFHTRQSYIDYFAKRIKSAVAKNNLDGILFSFHNIPSAYVKDGDRYPKECEETTKLIMEQVGDVNHVLAYQSVFGHDEWMEPQTEKIIKELPAKGIKRLLVVAPGFVADNLETILELDVEAREEFMNAGGEKFVYLPTFNADKELAEIITDLI
ncbi:MAG: ferrochelatase [Defluviitaleaceae bacterium]|nr:ferrochelatase [Defluviitaleaceae bacterium]